MSHFINNLKKSGIYRISNIETEECYIGSSKNLKNRQYTHFNDLKTNRHINSILQDLYNSKGENILKFEILEYCNIEDLKEKEQFWIDTVEPKYNIIKKASGNNKRSYNPSGSNYRQSELHVNKMREIAKKSAITNRKAIIAYDSFGIFYKEWQSIKEAEEDTKIFRSSISNNLHGKIITAGELRFFFKESDDYPLNIGRIYRSGGKSITDVYTKNKERFIGRFNSLTEAGEFLGETKGNMSYYKNRALDPKYVIVDVMVELEYEEMQRK